MGSFEPRPRSGDNLAIRPLLPPEELARSARDKNCSEERLVDGLRQLPYLSELELSYYFLEINSEVEERTLVRLLSIIAKTDSEILRSALLALAWSHREDDAYLEELGQVILSAGRDWPAIHSLLSTGIAGPRILEKVDLLLKNSVGESPMSSMSPYAWVRHLGGTEKAAQHAAAALSRNGAAFLLFAPPERALINIRRIFRPELPLGAFRERTEILPARLSEIRAGFMLIALREHPWLRQFVSWCAEQ